MGSFDVDGTHTSTGAYQVAFGAVLEFADNFARGANSVFLAGSTITGLGTLSINEGMNAEFRGNASVDIASFQLLGVGTRITLRANAVFAFTIGLWDNDGSLIGDGTVKVLSVFTVTADAEKFIGAVKIENRGTTTFDPMTLTCVASPQFDNFGQLLFNGTEFTQVNGIVIENKANQALISCSSATLYGTIINAMGTVELNDTSLNGRIDSNSVVEVRGDVLVNDGFFHQGAAGELKIYSTSGTSHGRIRLNNNDVALNGSLTQVTLFGRWMSIE